jgi:energy-coupling factor transport system substrate-specific component
VSSASQTVPALPDTHWRTRDIVVTAVIGVAFGVVFWAWGLAWAPIEAALGPARFLFYAVWSQPSSLRSSCASPAPRSSPRCWRPPSPR